MKSYLLLYTLLVLVTNSVAFTGKEDSANVSGGSLTIGLVRDNYNGFYTLGIGQYNLNKKSGICVYGLLRSLQFGLGPTFSLFDSKIVLIPMLGLAYGRKFSGNDHPIIGDAWIPSLILKSTFEQWFFDLTSFYYIPLRGAKKIGAEYLWYWFNGGIALSKVIKVGLHIESLRLIKSKVEPAGVLYFWVGPTISLNFSEHASFRLSGGKDLKASEYLKLDFIFLID